MIAAQINALVRFFVFCLAAFALALSGIVGVFFKPTGNEIRHGGEKWAIIYVSIGIGSILFATIQV